MSEHRKARTIASIMLVGVVAIVAAAFALGGNGGKSGEPAIFPDPPAASTGHTTSIPALPPGSADNSTSSSGSGGSPASSSGSGGTAAAGTTVAGVAPAVSGSGAKSGAGSGETQPASDAVAATRVVKNGTLDLRVARGQVLATVSKLVSLTTGMDGYVAQSQTSSVAGMPTGQVTLRMPVAQFDNAVRGVESLGHVLSLTTNADDVTGQVVDLAAQLDALQQTRSTYLTILGHAKTIGATLEVQQRVDDVQQEIAEFQGQLKVLRNQSADGTLTVDVTQVAAAKVTVTATHHKHSGIGQAWHRSISRFCRGFDAILGALGPILLVVLVLGALLGVGRLGYRGVRRATS